MNDVNGVGYGSRLVLSIPMRIHLSIWFVYLLNLIV